MPALPGAQPVPDAAGPAWRWTLTRRCALSPARAAGLCLAPCGFLVPLALAAWAAGYGAIAVFAAAEVLVLGAAWLAFARHALDGDVLTLRAGRLHVAQHDGPRQREHELDAAWLQVRVPAGPQALIELVQGGRRVVVGRHVCAHHRPPLAQALRRALAQAAAAR